MTYHLKDLFDIPLLEQFMQSFCGITGISTAVADLDGTMLARAGWQHICSHFHRAHPSSAHRCLRSDQYINDHLVNGHFIGYRCLNGLIDYATPIVVNNVHMGTLFIGQCLHEPPDIDYFRQQSRELGFDEESYLDALRQVPVVTAEQMNTILDVFASIAQFLFAMGLERLQRLKAEQATRFREDRLNLVLEGSQDGFWDWEVGSDRVFTSARCGEILGFKPDEAPSSMDAWMELIHPEDLPVVKKNIADNLQGKLSEYHVECRYRNRSGGWCWVLERGKVVSRSPEGQPLRMAGVITDITQRKIAETALKESEELYRTVAETSPNAITLTDLDGNIIYINRQGAQMYGWNDPGELLGHHYLILVAPEEYENAERDRKEVLQEGVKRNLEYTCICKDGSSRFVSELSSAVVRDALGNPRGFISLSQDISQRKQMEEELLQHRQHLQSLVQERTRALLLSEEKFSKAFNTSPITMAITTLEEGRFIEVNDSFCRILGFSRREIAGKTSLDIGFWVEKQDRLKLQRLLKNNGRVSNLEIEFQTRNQNVRLGLLSAERLDVGQEQCILSIVTDITERRNIDMNMARLDRLQLIGEMAASIGHEIRNPMTTVRGMLQLLSSDDAYQEDRELFDLMIEEMDRANSIISEFLSLAKNKRVELVSVNLATVLSNVLPLVQANAIAQDKRVAIQLDPVPECLLDEKEIRQLILNLSHNGLEAMSAGGTLSLHVFAQDNEIVLAVRDEGQGIPEELLEKIAIPFFSTKEKGTGLGLSVCYGIANRHNAHIEIKTGPDGTTFFVRFPCRIYQEALRA